MSAPGIAGRRQGNLYMPGKGPENMPLFRRAEKRLYFPGCLTKAKLPQIAEATRDAFRDLGIPFVTLPEMGCCGYPALYAGYRDEFERIAAENRSILEREGITQVVSNCPHCVLAFREAGVAARHTLELFDEHLNKVAKRHSLRANYHHPCFLEKLDVPAKVGVRVLRRAGVHVPNENPARGCCGSVGDDFARNNPENAAKIAAQRAKQFTEPLLVTSCPYCHLMFKKLKPRDVAELLGEE